MALGHGAGLQLFLTMLRCRGLPGAWSMRNSKANCNELTHHRISILCQSSHGEQAVIRVHYYIPSAFCVWKYRVRLYQFFRKTVIHSFEDVAAEARASATSDRVKKHETLVHAVKYAQIEPSWLKNCTSNESLPSASLSIISNTSSCTLSPAAYPAAQLFAAPLPCDPTKKFSGL